ASLFVENVMRPFAPQINEKNMLGVLRVVLIVFAVCATLQAVSNNATMYDMVQGAYSIVLVGAFVPLALGVYWRPASTQGAMLSIVAGTGVWLLVLFAFPDFIVPAQLCGLAASLMGMLMGSLIPQYGVNTAKA
ncbi:MAG: sodium:solute symporter, partial [Aureliella sp.]